MSARPFIYSTDPEWCAKCKHLPCVCPKPGTQPARLRLEKRRGKVVTVVAVTLPEPALRELLRGLQKACGSGGTVNETGIEIQGDHRDTVEARLRADGVKVKRIGG